MGRKSKNNTEELIKIVSSQGVWSLLSFILIYYILKQQEKRDLTQDSRELTYQKIITELTKKFEELNSSLEKIKQKLNI